MSYPVDDAYKAALASNLQTISRVDVLIDGVTKTEGVPIVGGSITIEANQAVRRHGSLQIEGWHNEISPYGVELAVFSGFVYPDGSEILIPLGVFGVEEPETGDDGKTLVTSCEIYDRARSLQGRRLANPYPVEAGMNVGEAIKELLLSRRPDLEFDFESTSATTPDLLLAEQADPWAEGQKLGAGTGMDLFFGPTGVPVLRTVPGVDPDNIDWEYVEGVGCQLTKVARKQTSEGIYSHAIATGETTDGSPPVRGDAYDDDPGSVTYYLGAFGDRPTWLRSPFIRDQPQADDASMGLLNRSSGIAEGISLSAKANPAVDADDTTLVQRARLGIDAVYSYNSVTLTLGPGGQISGSTRTRRIAT